MPKMKGHSGAGKRFRKTGTGKIVRARAGITHLREGKRSSTRRRLERRVTLAKGDERRVKRMLGN